LAAAFYRRDVLVAIGGFDMALGTSLADVAIALAIQALGKLHVCEPASELVRSRDPAIDAAAGFESGRAAERLFWLYAGQHGLAVAMCLHPIAIASDAVRCARSFSLVTSLFGRAAAWFEFGAARRHHEHLAAAAERLSDLAKLRAAVRMPTRCRADAPHAASVSRRRAA
jgi:hypothetical protein